MYLRHKIVTAVMALSVFTASAAGTGALASDDGNKKNASPAEPDVAVVMPDKPEGREAVKHCPSLSYGFEIVRRSRKMKKTSATSDVTFSHADFEEFCGGGVRTVTVTSLPPAEEGVLKLGALDVFEGQRLGAELLDLLVFVPSHPGSGSSFTFSVNDGGDVECVMYSAQYGTDAPVIASDGVTTVRDVIRYGRLSVNACSDVDFSVIKQPGHGLLTLYADGSFTYEPESGFTGRDSFVCAAEDKYGKSSDPLTVTVSVLKNTSPVRYGDVSGTEYEYPAYVLAQRGILTGQTVGGVCRFEPDAPVSRGDFIVMAMKAAGYAPGSRSSVTDAFADAAQMSEQGRGYAAAAVSAEVLTPENRDGTLLLRPGENVTRKEAADLVRALGADVKSDGDGILTRGEAALILSELIGSAG